LARCDVKDQDRGTIGRHAIGSKPAANEPWIDVDLRFANQWADEESGLHYNLNRHYDPKSGQYASVDPLGPIEGGLRTHGYVGNPTTWIDPLGLNGCPGTSNVDAVIAETLAGKGNLTSSTKLSSTELLQAGEKFLGPGYREIGKPGSGVFRSADGTRQFRIDGNSLSGNHAPGVPHGHLETYAPGRAIA
jgi:RHS repeat-associated protein